MKDSAGVRNETMDLQNQVQPANTRDLDKLNQSMASRPDLTPAAKQVVTSHPFTISIVPHAISEISMPFFTSQVCGSFRLEPCTPLQCEGGPLCPPEGTPVCEKGEGCVGALPLSKRAGADSEAVKERLDKLNGNITDAAEKVCTHTAICLTQSYTATHTYYHRKLFIYLFPHSYRKHK